MSITYMSKVANRENVVDIGGIMSGKGRFRELCNSWKGGRSIASNGYVLIRVGVVHHLADVRGYAYEHRIVAEQKIGRRLKKGEQVHHIDGDKQNNDPANLEVETSIAHHRLHHRTSGKELRMPDEANVTLLCSCGCGSPIEKFDRWGRPRKYVTGHNRRTNVS